MPTVFRSPFGKRIRIQTTIWIPVRYSFAQYYINNEQVKVRYSNVSTIQMFTIQIPIVLISLAPGRLWIKTCIFFRRENRSSLPSETFWSSLAVRIQSRTSHQRRRFGTKRMTRRFVNKLKNWLRSERNSLNVVLTIMWTNFFED